MNSRNPSDDLIENQQILLAQIKKSHRIFVLRFWVLFVVSLLAFGLIALLFFIEDESSIPSFIIFEAFPIILLVRSFKENWVFFKWSGPYLKAIEESGKTSPILTGLTSYVNRLYKAAFLDTILGWEKPELSPGQFFEEMNKRNRIKLVIVGILASIIGVFIFLTLQSGPLNAERVNILSFPLFAIIAIMVVMGIFQFIWMKSLKQWAQIFQELDAWGKQLEQDFLKSQFKEKGGV